MEKNVEKIGEISRLADSLWKYKKDILDLFTCPGDKSDEDLSKESVSILKEILKLHTKFNDYNEYNEYILSRSSKIKLPVSCEMFRNAFFTDSPIVLFDEELQKK